MTSTSSRRYVTPMDGLPSELAGMDSWLSEAYLAERLLLPVDVVRQAMMRLPRVVSPLTLAARWITGLVLAAGAAGVFFIHRHIHAAATHHSWGAVDEKAMVAGLSAVVFAVLLCFAAPRLTWWVRLKFSQPRWSAAIPVAGEALFWRAGALALLVAVCRSLM